MMTTWGTNVRSTKRAIGVMSVFAMGAGLALSSVPVTASAIPTDCDATAATWAEFEDNFETMGSGVLCLTNSISITGDAALLPAGAALVLDLDGWILTIDAAGTAESALGVPSGTTLTIRDSASGGPGTGTLNATGSDHDGEVYTVFGSGIGAGQDPFGKITILGGIINATGTYNGSGIGGASTENPSQSMAAKSTPRAATADQESASHHR